MEDLIRPKDERIRTTTRYLQSLYDFYKTMPETYKMDQENVVGMLAGAIRLLGETYEDPM